MNKIVVGIKVTRQSALEEWRTVSFKKPTKKYVVSSTPDYPVTFRGGESCLAETAALPSWNSDDSFLPSFFFFILLFPKNERADLTKGRICRRIEYDEALAALAGANYEMRKGGKRRDGRDKDREESNKELNSRPEKEVRGEKERGKYEWKGLIFWNVGGSEQAAGTELKGEPSRRKS